MKVLASWCAVEESWLLQTRLLQVTEFHAPASFASELRAVAIGPQEDAGRENAELECISRPSISSWEAGGIERLCKQGRLDKALLALRRLNKQGILPSVHLYQQILQACIKHKALPEAKWLHAHLVHHGLEFDRILGEFLVSALVKCGSLADGLHLFRRLSHRTVVSWSAIISGYCRSGQSKEALSCYERMRDEDVQPNGYTFLCLLKACRTMDDLKWVHTEVWRHGFHSDAFIGSMLVSMYAKFGSIMYAQQVFDGLPKRDHVVWNAMLAAYAQQNQGGKTLELYLQMQEEGVRPDARSFVSVLQACGSIAELEAIAFVDGQNVKVQSLQRGKAIHAEAVQRGFESNLFVGNTLVSMYAKCGSMVDAQRVFDSLPQHDVASWNAMLAAYAQQEQGEKALHVFRQMSGNKVKPDARTFVSAVQACGMLAEGEESWLVDGLKLKVETLRLGKEIHAGAIKFASNVFVSNSLIGMYAKCGSIMDAELVFDTLSQRNTVSWNVMLAAYAQQDHCEQALQIYQKMQEQGLEPDARTLVSLLQACSALADREGTELKDMQSVKVESLQKGKELHAIAAWKGFESDVFVGSALVSMYTKCGSIIDAQQVFDRLHQRDVVSWTALISAYAQEEQGEKALQIFCQMQEECVPPDAWTFVSTLQACSALAQQEESTYVDGQNLKVESLRKGKEIHAEALKKDLDLDLFVGNTLVNMYAKCGSIHDAEEMFDRLPRRDLVSWNSMLSAYAQQGQGEKVLHTFWAMQDEVIPNGLTFLSAIQACGITAEMGQSTLVGGQHVKMESLHKGKELHAALTLMGFEADEFINNSTISMYAKCGSVKDAQQVFDRLFQPDVISWTALIAAYIQQGHGEVGIQLYCHMQDKGVMPDAQTFVNTLQACYIVAQKEEGALVDGENLKVHSLQRSKEIHAQVACMGFASDLFVASTLVSTYAVCGSIEDAEEVFIQCHHRDGIMWNAMLSAFVQQRQGGKALEVYQQMQQEGIYMDARTFVSTIEACATLTEQEESVHVNGQDVKISSLQMGKEIHAAAVKHFESDIFVGSALIGMYAKCRSIGDAQTVFNTFCQHDTVSWTSLIAAYAEQGQGEMGLQIFQQMKDKGAVPNAYTFVSALQACSIIAQDEKRAIVSGQYIKVQSLQKVQHLHGEAVSIGLETNVFVCSSLIHAYAKCGSIPDAEQVFNKISQHCTVSWTAMIAAYAQDHGEKAVQLYGQMQAQGVQSHEATFVAVLEACSNIGALDICMQAHQAIVQKGLECSRSVATSLIHAYGKCGNVRAAQDVFDLLPTPDVVAWTSLIAGYARQGSGKMTMQCYNDMCSAGVKPNRVTFLTLLSACNHAGLVDEGLEYFESMDRDHGISPELEHYACVIDLVSRAGHFSKAEEFLSQMPLQPDLPLWLCLLGACRKHGNLDLGKRAFNSAVELEPKQAAAYLLMSNIYAQAGMWECAKETEEQRKIAGAWKMPGHSWIEHEQEVHTFVVRDSRHQQEPVLYELLNELRAKLRIQGGT